MLHTEGTYKKTFNYKYCYYKHVKKCKLLSKRNMKWKMTAPLATFKQYVWNKGDLNLQYNTDHTHLWV